MAALHAPRRAAGIDAALVVGIGIGIGIGIQGPGGISTKQRGKGAGIRQGAAHGEPSEDAWWRGGERVVTRGSHGSAGKRDPGSVIVPRSAEWIGAHPRVSPLYPRKTHQHKGSLLRVAMCH